MPGRKAATMLALALVMAAAASAAFIEVPEEARFPRESADKHHVITAPYILLDGQHTPMTYNTILTSGDRTNQNESFAFGQAFDQNMQPLYEVNFEGVANFTILDDGTKDENLTMSHSQDFTSLIPVGDRLFSFVHFESPVPSAIYMVELKQDTETCHLQPISQKPTDWSAWGGLWTPCAGSVTPWGTHLGSEEYEPNALAFVAATSLEDMENYADAEGILDFMRYFGKYPNDTSLEDVQELLKPYRYGHPTELTAYANGSYKVEKHYAMGRQSYELPFVMPDNVTVYATDDGENTMLTMFKASSPSNLTCGTLYGGAFMQLSDENGGNFTIEWLDMGYACQDDLRPLADNTTFFDIFEWVPYNSSTGCPRGFSSINTGMPNGAECLRLLPGMEIVASRFETRRYLALIGGTTEFTKWEGLTFAPDHGQYGKIYTSMSRIENSMEDSSSKGEADDTYDEGGPNSIRIPWNRCGCVYQLDLDQDYNATAMYALVCGNTDTNTDENNKCDIQAISAPDNIAMMQGHNELIIGEDTSDHQNDIVWLYNFETQALRRMQTTPYGAEATSAYWYENLNGCAYWISVIQHPYGESDQERVVELPSTGKAGRIGYLGPIKAAPSSVVSTASVQG